MIIWRKFYMWKSEVKNKWLFEEKFIYTDLKWKISDSLKKILYIEISNEK